MVKLTQHLVRVRCSGIDGVFDRGFVLLDGNVRLAGTAGVAVVGGGVIFRYVFVVGGGHFCGRVLDGFTGSVFGR